MQLDANDLLLFARVAEEGSFSKAAERAGLPKSTVSRRVAALETELGERLLLRTTRKLTVTDFGHSVLEHAQQLAAEVDAAQSLAQHRQAMPSGRLRVSLPGDFANVVMEQLLSRFIEQYPAIQLELDVSPRRVDLIGENFDLAIRMGDLPDDASLAARRLAVFSAGLYASPTYLARRGMPLAPAELLEHDALRLLSRSGEPMTWVLKRDNMRWEGLPPGRATVNSPELLIRLARTGAGITIVPDHYADQYVKSGELLQVLPEWQAQATTAWAVFPGRRLMPARTRVFIDELTKALSGPKCQEQDALRKRRRPASTS